jgi:hypothetical protein
VGILSLYLNPLNTTLPKRKNALQLNKLVAVQKIAVLEGSVVKEIKGVLHRMNLTGQIGRVKLKRVER